MDQSQKESHVRANHIIKCSSCTVQVHTQAQLDDHIMEKHAILCKVCANKFKDPSQLDSHVKKEHVHCPLCSIDFKDKNAYTMHFKILTTVQCVTKILKVIKQLRNTWTPPTSTAEVLAVSIFQHRLPWATT